MGDVWYNEIALRNGGYKSNAVYTQIGISGEGEFEKELLGLLKPTDYVLDAGCGHGEFTIHIAKHVKHIVGFDYSNELLRIAQDEKGKSNSTNVEFVFATTKEPLPFSEKSFDVIYSRRGPTSIIKHSYLLKDNGCICGIHSAAKDVVIQRLQENGLQDIVIEDYPNSYLLFDSKVEYAKYLSAFPGNPDFFLAENKDKLKSLITENTVDGIIKVQEWRYVWKAYKR